LDAASGEGRMLDLACGTGQIAFGLAHRFAEVWAVDQEPDMIAVLVEKARAAEARQIRGVVSRAEELAAPAGGFELVAIGNAFHRLQREAVAERAFGWLAPGGSIALLWATAPWAGNEEWERALSALLESWKVRVGAQDRVPAGWDRARKKQPDAAVLREAGFEVIRTARFPTVHEWTVEALIGLVYSTSFLPRAVVGERAGEFEREVRSALGAHASGGGLRETVDFAYERSPTRERSAVVAQSAGVRAQGSIG
jgi:SAM-dependent methyltransferase